MFCCLTASTKALLCMADAEFGIKLVKSNV